MPEIFLHFILCNEKNQQKKAVESTVKGDSYCFHCENSREGVWLQIIVDFEFTKNKQLEFNIG